MVESSQNAGMAFSNAVADAVDRGGAITLLVNARRRLPLSGILYASDLVLTASHGVEREEDIQVILPDGRELAASLAGRDPGSDLAVLRLKEAVHDAPARPAETAARVGHLVVATGRPSTDGVQASLGMVIALGSGLRTMRGSLIERYLLSDVVMYPGFSGGPLVDLAGGLLGINTSGLIRGTSLSIPAGLAWEIAGVLAEHGHIQRGYLGIRSQVVELPDAARAALGRDQATGLLLVGIEPQGPAAGGTLMVGDILVGLNGQPVANHDDLLALLVGEVVGREIPAQVLRGGQPVNLQVKAGERK
jgi:S1-C subfamily serine protease